jgi:hypothetical protein
MLVLSIVAFAIEILFLVITSALTQVNGAVSPGYAWFVIFVYIVCTILAVVALVRSILMIRDPYERGKAITGTVFSGIALFIGAIFIITTFVTVIALLGKA